MQTEMNAVASHELEMEMKKFNIDFLLKSDIPEDEYLSVEIDIDCPFTLDSIMQNHVLTRKVKRGTVYYLSFLKNKRDMLTLKLACKVPRDFAEIYFESFCHQMINSTRANTFPDLCWIMSEGTKNTDLDQVFTQVREGIKLGDLTNILPSKFIDDMIEVMHVLNHGIIEGIMSDGIVYGPYIFNKKNLLQLSEYFENGLLKS